MAAVLGTVVYCLLYTALSGEPESPVGATLWAVVNVLPWVIAFEAAKRSGTMRGAASALAVALAASLLTDLALGGADSLIFELVRRIPALLAVSGLLLLGHLLNARTAEAASSTELPLTPAQIDWIAAAGNYVELHGCGRTIVHRTSLAALERRLAGEGFVRIHRSTLVRRDRIARVRPLDVLLADGTSLKVGHRYRARLQRA